MKHYISPIIRFYGVEHREIVTTSIIIDDDIIVDDQQAPVRRDTDWGNYGK